MRIKLQALTEHIHGFLLILGITAFLSCLIFPSHYLFYFFHSFLLLIPFAVTAYGQEKIKHFVMMQISRTEKMMTAFAGEGILSRKS